MKNVQITIDQATLAAVDKAAVPLAPGERSGPLPILALGLEDA